MAHYHGGQYHGQQQQPPQPRQYGNAPSQAVPYPDDPYQTPYTAESSAPWQDAGGYDAYPSGYAPSAPPHQDSYATSTQSPRTLSYAATSPAHSQPYHSQPSSATSLSYNPQQYAPVSQYNPQAYGNVDRQYGSMSPQTYNPAAFVEHPVQRAVGPVDPYAYSPAPYSASASYPSPQPGFHHHSPHVQHGQYAERHHSSHSADLSPPPPPSLYNYQTEYADSRSHTSTYTPPTGSAPYPSQFSPQPSSDWRVLAGGQSSITVRDPTYASISPALPGLHDTSGLPSPPQYQSLNSHYDPYVDRQSPSPLYPMGSNPLPSPPGPTPPAHAPLRMNTLDRHPEGRPLPGRPPDQSCNADYFQQPNDNGRSDRQHEEALAQEALFSQVENQLRSPGNGHQETRQSPRIEIQQPPFSHADQPPPLFSPRANNARTSRNGRGVNGNVSPDTAAYGRNEDSSAESDAEATAGLEAMRMAEEADTVDAARRQSGQGLLFNGYNSQRRSRREAHADRDGSGSDSDNYANVDILGYGGGYEAHMSYGGDPETLAAGGEARDLPSHPVSSTGSMRKSQASSIPEYDYAMDSIHPFPPFIAPAQVATMGTGGLSEPSAYGRRPSFDEGDEYSLMEDVPVDDRVALPDLFYHPETSPYRPLPPPPPGDRISHLLPAGTYPNDWRSQPGTPIQTPYPDAPGAYAQSSASGTFPRSTSLLSHTTTPQVLQPIRSKTDAEERRLRQQQYRSSLYLDSSSPASASASAIAIDLPSLPTKRFSPAKLGAPDFKKCAEPWALSGILRWLREVTNPDQMTELKESAVKEALVALFTNKVPTMNIADAETLGARVIEDMYAARTLVRTEEWVRIVSGHMSGVIFQLTLAGCYSSTLHDHIVPGRCYSHHCQRTLKKIDLKAQSPAQRLEDWQTFYKMTKERVEGMNKKEIERQNILHEIVQTEDGYINQLNILRTLYRDPLAVAEPPVINPKRLRNFLKDVFGKIEPVKKANEEHLLAQLKYRQQEQGPWIVGFSDISRQWIRKARTAYIEYAAAFPGATFLVRQELERNLEFRAFLDRARNSNPKRLDWDTYLKAPITRLQHFGLLLSTSLRNMQTESEEKKNLQIAIEEIKAVTLECDARVAEMQRKVDLNDLNARLILRPGMKERIELNLNHLGRELIYRGELQRMGTNRFTWLESHGLLFDHYFVLAKTISQRDSAGGRYEKYDVSRMPIPMDLLILESTNESAVMKSSYVKGITSVTTVSSRNPEASDTSKLNRTATNQSQQPHGLQHTNTANSMNSLHTVNSSPGKMVGATLLEGTRDSDEKKIMYPFRIKHLGTETYTLFAPSEQKRSEWCNAIIKAKTKHAKALFAQHAEPFHLRVIADSAFVYDPTSTAGMGSGRNTVIEGTPVDRALKEVEKRFKDTGRPVPICRVKVNCATGFWTSEKGAMVAVGAEYGVYITEAENPRGWSRAIQVSHVTQIAVLEEFNLILLIADRTLIAYHLDVILPAALSGTVAANSESARKAPQKLSGSKDVGFFATGRMKDRTLVFYQKRSGLSSTFKVLEPVYQKSTEKKRAFGGLGMGAKKGSTEFFREYDEFYIPTECFGISLFQTSLAISTAKGFEVLTLDKKHSFSIPDLSPPHCSAIAGHLTNQMPLNMLRLSEQEFLLCFERCAVYVNKHGDVSRSVVMAFVGKASRATLVNGPPGAGGAQGGCYLVLFCEGFVEVREARMGTLKQVIPGRDIRCLDDGGGASVGGGAGAGAGAVVNGAGQLDRTVKVVMQHPEVERTQVVLELVLNEGMKE
ncbi:Rho guanine nucleotide exchange factor [Elasticomyces elasticus]|nr:Rho guanine nucleotide exchange factor [Elasticomyces elasticus]